MAEYISRSKAEFELCEGNIPEPYRSFCRRVINDRNLIPAADVVSRAAYDQTAWERDLAIQQLKSDYGVGLGERKADMAPVRHAFWKEIGADKRGRGGIFRCAGADGCGKTHPYTCDYCPNCGARMDGARNGEEKD